MQGDGQERDFVVSVHGLHLAGGRRQILSGSLIPHSRNASLDACLLYTSDAADE